MVAAGAGSLSTVRELLRHNPRVGLKDSNGRTALNYAQLAVANTNMRAEHERADVLTLLEAALSPT